MKNTKITNIRLLTLFGFWLFFSFGGQFIGGQREILLPVFNCEYIGDGTTRGACIALVKLVSSFMSTSAFISLVGCIVLVFLFGRLWCGYVCPFGFMQDFMTLVRKKLKLTQVQFSSKLTPVLTLGKWFLVFYIFFYDFCSVCPVQNFTVTTTGYVSVETNTTNIFWAVVLLTLAFLNERAFCKVCPLGALMGLTNRLSGSRIKKCGNACTHCRACLEVCPMNIQEVYEDRTHADITHPDCIYCMKCIEVCPEKKALRYDLMGKTIIESQRHTR